MQNLKYISLYVCSAQTIKFLSSSNNVYLNLLFSFSNNDHGFMPQKYNFSLQHYNLLYLTLVKFNTVSFSNNFYFLILCFTKKSVCS